MTKDVQQIFSQLPQRFILGIHAPLFQRSKAYQVLHHLPYPGVCVTLHQPSHNLYDLLRRSGLPADKLYFIDAISKRIQSPFELAQASYVGGPFDLGRLQEAIEHVVPRHGVGRKFLIFDSLHDLFHFYDERTILLFLDYFLDKMRTLHVNPIFLYDKTKLTRRVIKRLQLYCHHLLEA
ncbi:hypothetical protein HYS50_01790 [Candidatus Woesearchaeota archaeon]|nr:hypothetical protein [Candidatus Woesearchaeota archaeon]